jgi:Na+/H+-dicarboxylate symporter
VAAAWNTVSTRILAGLIVGLALGAWGGAQGWAGPGVLRAAETVGGLWLNGLTMTVVPLVFGLLVTGIAASAAEASTSRVALRALIGFALALLAACIVGAAAALGMLGLAPVPAVADALRPVGEAPQIAPAKDWLSALIPTNPIKAAAETAVAPLVVFAVVFGFALTRIEASLRTSLTTFFQAVVATMLVIVQWVLLVAPLGVAALAFVVGARLGIGAAGALAHYVLVVSAVCLTVTVLAYAAVWILGALSPIRFARAALPAQVVAVSTQSSLASLPAMVRAAGPMDVPAQTAGIVLPLAVAIFRAASAAANIAVAVYLAHLHGVALSPATLGVGIAVAAVVSLAAVGLPAQVSFFATIGPVCLAMGVPIVLLGLLLAVETIPDIFRTLGNVTSDLALTRIVGRRRKRTD